ncbi:hypothetical protein E2542_SST15900 [Spatholobus suberectus]|nr:hypothetical protein E2542_SST15900 [Spatholobus suberectus]
MLAACTMAEDVDKCVAAPSYKEYHTNERPWKILYSNQLDFNNKNRISKDDLYVVYGSLSLSLTPHAPLPLMLRLSFIYKS